MSKEDVSKILTDIDALIIVKVNGGEQDSYEAPFEYVSGDFASYGLGNLRSFYDVVKSIYRSSSICEGIGYYEYCNQIKEGIRLCKQNGSKMSFILPLRKGGSVGKTQYFFMTVNKANDSLLAAFLYCDEKSSILSLEDFSSGNFKDRLTGLFNYRTLVSHIVENKRRGYLCLYDLNKFKQVNDVYGHETGDAVLKLVADHLISIASMNEVYYRRSGDEFVILVFETNKKHMLGLISKINTFIQSIPSLLNKEFEIGAAFGVLELTVPKEGETAFDYETQFKLIDLAMYQAKKSEKLYHYISHEDALAIYEKGDLDRRIEALARSLKR